MLKKLNELKIQLDQKEKYNNQLKSQLIRAENHNKELEKQLQHLRNQENDLKKHIRNLEEQKVSQSLESVPLAPDEEVVKLKAIHKAELRAKEEIISDLSAKLAAYKEPLSETDFFMQNAALKKEIEIQRKQILDLSNHAEQNKEQH